MTFVKPENENKDGGQTWREDWRKTEKKKEIKLNETKQIHERRKNK